MNTTPNEQNSNKIPDKFFDKEKNEIRVDALLKSYLELEKKLAQKPAAEKPPAEIIHNLLDIPASPNEYKITISHDMFTTDDEINQRLFEKGYTNEQAQFLYDLAAEKMVPLILDISREFEAERQLEKLNTAFGGKERFREVSRQLLAYGKKNLPKDVLDSLASTYEGVMALYRMMQTGKPLGVQAPTENTGVDETALRAMMRDPKYWRDKDSAFIQKVSDGFRQVFAEQE
ncbi:MAG: hypothetical protein JWM96_225 [Alphaproteobacteria bacterium]|nr:hypothetical protein [Alphaproteobacteria bacterium]